MLPQSNDASNTICFLDVFKDLKILSYTFFILDIQYNYIVDNNHIYISWKEHL